MPEEIDVSTSTGQTVQVGVTCPDCAHEFDKEITIDLLIQGTAEITW